MSNQAGVMMQKSGKVDDVLTPEDEDELSISGSMAENDDLDTAVDDLGLYPDADTDEEPSELGLGDQVNNAEKSRRGG